MGLALSCGAIFLMAASLSSMKLDPGNPVSIGSDDYWTYTMVGASSFMIILIRAAFIVAGILLPLSLVYLMRSREGRRRIIIFIVAILAMSYLIQHVPKKRLNIEIPNIKIIIAEAEKSAPTEKYTPSPPAWVVLAFSIGLSVLLSAIGLLVWYYISKRSSPMKRVVEEVQKTIEDIESCGNLKEGVIRCYHEMNNVLDEQKGMKRNRSMTTREFENRLEEAGLGLAQISRLTRLFEMVRYGSKNLGKDQEAEALDCLREIVKYCEDLP